MAGRDQGSDDCLSMAIEPVPDEALPKRRLGPRKGSKQTPHPMANRMLDVMFSLHGGGYGEGYMRHEFGEDPINTTRLGCFCALLRHRAYCELIHQDQPKKTQGKRPTRGEDDRTDGSTSHRLDFFFLPEEWGVVKYCLPDADHFLPCGVRICFGLPKRQALGDMGWLPDDENTAFPDNEGNETLEASLLDVVDKADGLLPRGPMTAMAAYREASESGFAGVMTLSVAPRLEPPAMDGGVVYFAPDYRRDSCKIGTSKSPAARIKAVATYRSGMPVIMAMLRGGKFTEAMVHKKLAKHRIDREHYRLGPTFQFLRDMAIRNAPLYTLLET